MKFGALLRQSAEDTPELAGLFVAYKALKKKLKALPAAPAPAAGSDAGGGADVAVGAGGGDVAAGDAPTGDAAAPPRPTMTPAEAAFAAELAADIRQFNHEFMEREEDAVIRLRSLEDDAKAAVHGGDAGAAAAAYRRLVDFHGELLIVVHWSILAYTGLVKILKKHHKRTGLLLRAPGLDNLLSQPFCSVELITDLAHKAEAAIAACGEGLGGGAAAPPRPGGGAAAAGLVAAARARLSASVEAEAEAGDASSDSDDGGGGGGGAGLARAASAAALRAAAAAAAGPPQPADPTAAPRPPASMMRQAEAALGLWSALRSTAATPSTVLAPGSGAAHDALAARAAKRARAATSLSTDASAA